MNKTEQRIVLSVLYDVKEYVAKTNSTFDAAKHNYKKQIYGAYRIPVRVWSEVEELYYAERE